MFEKIIRDPIHHFITFNDENIYKVLRTKEFQRLQNINQSYSVKYAYPGSSHSRFLHCMGTYEITRRIVERHSSEFSSYDKLLVQLSALLHDVGHGPLSHTFEMFTNLSHEAYGVKIINSKNTEIGKLLNKIDKRLPKDIGDVLNKKYHNNLVNQIVSSQIDADRMDYLLRDGHFSGVSYSFFDLELLLKSLNFFEKEGMKIMGFDLNCVHILEKYLLGRLHLYKQVVLHPKSVGFEVLLLMIIKRLKDLYNNNYNFISNIDLLRPILNGRNFSVEEYVELNDFNFMTTIFELQKESDPILKDLVYRMTTARLFKYDKDVSGAKQKELKEDLIKRGMDPNYYFHHFSSKNIAYKSVSNITEQNVYIMDVDKKHYVIDKFSSVLKGLGETEEKIEYLFYG